MSRNAETMTVTETERNEAKAALVHTEQINAVNSGIAKSSDKSRMTLSADLYDQTSKTSKQSFSHTASHRDTLASRSNFSESGSITAKEASKTQGFTSGQKKIQLKEAIASRASAAVLEDSELDGTDNVYYGSKGMVKGAKQMKQHASLQNKSLGKLAEKNYQKPQNSKELRRMMQTKRNQTVSRSLVQAEKTRRGIQSGLGLKAAGAKAAGGAAGSGGVAAAGGIGAFPILLILFLFISIVIIIGAISSENNTEVKALSGNEKIVAEYLLAKGLDPLHTAAIMGNIKAESNFDSQSIEHGNGIGLGLCQWSFGRRTQLEHYAAAKNKSPGDIHLQLDFLWAELTGEGDAAFFANVQYPHAGFLSVSDLTDAVYYFGRRFERPDEAKAHWESRIEAAKAYYQAMTGGNLSARLEEAKKHLGKPYVWGAVGPDAFDCSGFITYVLNRSGYATGRLTAAGFYNKCEKIPEAEAKPGDLIFFRGTYGPADFVSHIGFYLGDGEMLHCGSPVQIASFKDAYWQAHSPEFGRLP